MKAIYHTILYVTWLLGVGLIVPVKGEANLTNYGHNAKGNLLQATNSTLSRDTVPTGEPENFDAPFGSGVDYKPHDPDPFATRDAGSSKIIQAVKVEVNKPKPKLFKVPSDYTGYKIEIKNTAKPLSASNDIFFQHGKLYAEKLQDGSISYLLGDFDDAEAAGRFMSDFLARRYPDAKVIEYHNGNRLN